MCCSPAPVRAWNTPLMRPHRGATKGPLSPRFTPSRGAAAFSCPPSTRLGCKRRLRALRALRPPSRCWSQPGAAAEPGQRPAHPAPAPINSRCPDKILLSSGLFFLLQGRVKAEPPKALKAFAQNKATNVLHWLGFLPRGGERFGHFQGPKGQEPSPGMCRT